MKKFLGAGLVLALVVFVFSTPTMAVDVGLGPKIGTTGPGAEVTTKFNDNFGLRYGVNWLPRSRMRSVSVSGTDYSLYATLFTMGVVADWYPMGGPFRVSAGLFYNGSVADMGGSVNQTGTITIGGITYAGNVVGEVSGDIRWNPISPYLGAGFCRKFGESNWSFGLDAGVLYIGKPKANLDVQDPQGLVSAQAVSAEEEKIEDRTHRIIGDFYPVLTFSFKYHF